MAFAISENCGLAYWPLRQLLDYTAEGEPVVHNNGAVPIAAEKELDFGCAPTPDSNNTIAEVLNGGDWWRSDRDRM